MSIRFTPIRVIHSPFTDPKSMPIQPVSRNSAAGTVEVFPEFAPGLKDLEGFSYIIMCLALIVCRVRGSAGCRRRPPKCAARRRITAFTDGVA
jgi:tRNA (Thr-GGU) A37 N-methylase